MVNSSSDRFGRMSTTEFICMVLALLLVLAIVVFTISGWHLAQQQRTKRMEAHASMLGALVNNRLIQLEHMLQLAAPDNEPSALAPEALSRLIQVLNGERHDISWLQWIDATGRVVVNWPPRNAPQVVEGQTLLAERRGKRNSGLRLLILPGSGSGMRSQLVVARSLFLADGRTKGVQLVGVQPEYLLGPVSMGLLSERTNFLLLNDESGLLYQRHAEKDAAFLSRLGGYQRGLPAGTSLWVADHANTAAGRSLLLLRLPDYPLTLVMVAPEGELSDIPIILWWALLAALLLLLVPLLLLFWRRATRLRKDDEQLLLTQFTVDHNDDMVFWADADGRFRYVNESAARHLGYSREALQQMSVSQVDPTYTPAVYMQFFQRLRKERSIAIESSLQTSNGQIFPVEIVANYMNPAGREFNCAIVRDISSRQADQAQLQRLSQQLLLALQSMRAGLWEWRIGDDSVLWDEQHCRLFGLNVSRRELTLEQWLAMIAVADRERLRAELQSAAARDLELNLECGLLLPSGESRYLRICGKLERDAAGQVNRMVGLSFDISATRQAENLVRTVSKVSDRAQGEDFFRSFVLELARVWPCRCLLVGELLPASDGHPAQVRSLAMTQGNQLGENCQFDLLGSAAADVLARGVGIYPERVQSMFPNDSLLHRFEAQSYIGLPLLGARGEALGVLLCLDDKPLRDINALHSLLSIFATRLGAELERARTHSAMQAQSAYVEHLLLHAPVVICRIAADGRIVDINQAVQAITGHLPQDLIDASWASIFGSRAQLDNNRSLLLNPERRVLSNLELTMLTRNGQPRTLMWNAAQRLDDNGQLLDVVAVGVDVSARLTAEAEVRALNAKLEQRVVERTEQLQQAISELESFSYSVSHDLRAPLRSISGFCGMLVEDYTDKLDAQGQDYLQRISRSAARMGGLIDDLLDLSRVSRQPLRCSSCDLGEMARHTFAELHSAQPQRQLELVCDDGLQVFADVGLMQIVLDNLLRNAWKFTARKAQAHIHLGQREQGGERVYFVRDDGAGFDMTYAARLFGAFQRLHDANEFEGTGIGLAIVQRIIHRHGGRIWAEGEVDKGACFYFTLSQSIPAQ